jgi:hypothetical protein
MALLSSTALLMQVMLHMGRTSTCVRHIFSMHALATRCTAPTPICKASIMTAAAPGLLAVGSSTLRALPGSASEALNTTN